ncbi:hypothetical protein AB751O23_BR_00020 [Chlamydiales bacterium SCGC AB-751-O23]|jgi:nitrogen fixation/metabolism regulation signal transduction histidine kinase|nr:hypothetical protein AB751O23_BR_00020 [Chlamydiales bacterium SCGC AB-751-O23]
MAHSVLSKLNKQVSNLGKEKISDNKVETLTLAFKTFTEEAQRLEIEYKKLKERFRKVNLELELTNKELKTKVLELNYITGYLNSILSNIQQGLIFIDLSGTIITVNQAAEKILNLSLDQLLCKNYKKTLGDNFFGFSITENLKQKKDIALHLASLQQKELEISTSFVDKGPPSHHGLIILIKDITELCHLQLLNNRNDRLKELGEMAAKVAHEIRNPLGGIEGFATLLQRDLEKQPAAQNMAENILSGAKIISRLVSSILDYSKPMQPNLELKEINKLVEKCIEMISVDSRFAAGHRINFQSEIQATELFVDPQLIISALWNLLINSSEAMPQKGAITVKLFKQEDSVCLQVIDQGEGIPEENLENIFSPLFTSKQKGNGLGLSEVYKIIQLHGGEIAVSSKAKKGSCFTIKFPLKIKQKS